VREREREKEREKREEVGNTKVMHFEKKDEL
jgi:hypothetical protein